VISALLLLLEASILLALGIDLGRDFALLEPFIRTILMLLAAAGLLALARRPAGGIRRGFAAPIAVLAAAAVLLAALGLARDRVSTAIARHWEAGARGRLESRALPLQGDFAAFLGRLQAPLDETGADPPGVREAFDLAASALSRSGLSPERAGFALYRPDGSILAWDGNSTAAPPEMIASAGPTPQYRVAGSETSPRLFAVTAPAPNRLRRVVEFLLRAGPDPTPDEEGGPRLDFLPHWTPAGPAHVHLPLGGAADDLTRFFERQGDRYWGRLGREAVLSLSFPLRSPSGNSLAIVTLRDRRPIQAIGDFVRSSRRAGAFVLAAAVLLAWWLLRRASSQGPLGGLLLGSAALWAVRLALLPIGAAADLPSLPLFDIGLYASPAYGGLARSPADLLLTALVSVAQAWILRTALRASAVPSHARKRRRRARGAGLAALAALAGGLFALHRFLDRMVLDARVDLGRVEFDSHFAPRAALQASLFFLVTASAVTIAAFLEVAARCGQGRGARSLSLALGRIRIAPAPRALRFVAGVLALTLLYLPFLHHAYDRLRQEFFEDDLLPRVVDQKERRAQILRDSLGQTQDEGFAAAASFAAEQGSEAGGAAYRLWTDTPLAEAGLASSLRIFDAQGRLLDRFSVNLAPGLEVPFAAAAAAAGGDLTEEPARPHAIVRKAVMFGSRSLRAPRRPPLLVVMTVVDDYDNLPLVGSDSGSVPLFRARAIARTNPEILRFDPMVAVFGPHLETLYESGGEIPPPSERVLRDLEGRKFAWATAAVGEMPARILYSRGQGVLFALAQPHAGPAALLASYLRLFLLNAVLAALLLGVRLRSRSAHGGAPAAAHTATFYGRLTAVVVLTALLPLLALALFVTRFSAREFDRDLTSAGLGSLQVARRVAEDYLQVGGQEGESATPVLDDDVVFWISRVVRQDLHVYRGADLLATSTRELFGSGLLNTRLDGEVYRALYLDREPFRQTRERGLGLESLTLSAPMRVDREGTAGVIAVPLTVQRRAIAHKVEEVEDAVLISTCLTVLLLAIVGYIVARRVSEPITQLSRAARRVAEGDLEVRVEARSADEIGVLVDAFNRMAASLRSQREDLRRRKDYIEKILGSATTGVVSIDADGATITINPAAQNLLRDAAPAPGESLPERLQRDPALRPLAAALGRALEGRPEAVADIVLPGERAERRLRAVFIPFAPGEGSPPGTIVLLEDVTEIVRSGRLAAWADMARRIAHEIKNPLTPIQLSVEHARRLWKAGDARFGVVLEQCLDNIQRQVRELRQIASGFSDYARLPEVRPEPVEVSAILDDALAPYLAAPPPGIRIAREIPPGLPRVLADRPTLARAFVNLIENALQAMPHGGSLSLRAARAPGDGHRVEIEVRDTGIGIDPAILPRLFEPYFSTRSGGTGLGLAIVRRAVEDHGGTIGIDSRPGAGTVIRVALPTAPEGAEIPPGPRP
jgi:signal transduction histidine kinase/HAMP domain-containing protein